MKTKKQAYASKTSMNLAIKEKTINLAILIPGVLVIAVLAGLLGKFGVADRLAAVSRLEGQVRMLTTQLQDTQRQYEDYDEVLQQYNRYTYKDFDRTLADRLDVLQLMQEKICTICDVKSLTLTGRQMNLSLGGLTLETTSRLIATLEADPLVERVYVSTYNVTETNASTNEEETVTVTQMAITLADATQAAKEGNG